jgi:hypothetical protein
MRECGFALAVSIGPLRQQPEIRTRTRLRGQRSEGTGNSSLQKTRRPRRPSFAARKARTGANFVNSPQIPIDGRSSLKVRPHEFEPVPGLLRPERAVCASHRTRRKKRTHWRSESRTSAEDVAKPGTGSNSGGNAVTLSRCQSGRCDSDPKFVPVPACAGHGVRSSERGGVHCEAPEPRPQTARAAPRGQA